jgi:hypothetical protein
MPDYFIIDSHTYANFATYPVDNVSGGLRSVGI